MQVQQKLQVSERRACRVLKHCRATHQYVVDPPEDEARLRTRIIELAMRMGGMAIDGLPPSCIEKAGR